VHLAAGLPTASLVSGYQGRPPGGLDKEVQRLGRRASEHEIVMRPAVNEQGRRPPDPLIETIR
jgi:TPP-dependent indolepyruvate ferredoxin oxidoreductase alpha subunit